MHSAQRRRGAFPVEDVGKDRIPMPSGRGRERSRDIAGILCPEEPGTPEPFVQDRELVFGRFDTDAELSVGVQHKRRTGGARRGHVQRVFIALRSDGEGRRGHGGADADLAVSGHHE